MQCVVFLRKIRISEIFHLFKKELVLPRSYCYNFHLEDVGDQKILNT